MKRVCFGVAVLVLAASTAFAEVHVTMQNGRVTVVAKDATVRQILTEWARVGQTKIVNVERIPGGPITLELTNVPEGQALDILLRTLSGYITAPRAVEAANLSTFDRIIVMPTLAAVRPTVSSAAPPPVYQQPTQVTQQAPVANDDDPDEQRPSPSAVPPTGRAPVFNSFPQPQVVNPNPMPSAPVAFPGAVAAPVNPPPQQPAQPVNSATPTSPYGGVARPGMIVPPPPQPGQQPGQQPGTVQQPGTTQQPGVTQPVRRPGGEQ